MLAWNSLSDLISISIATKKATLIVDMMEGLKIKSITKYCAKNSVGQDIGEEWTV